MTTTGKIPAAEALPLADLITPVDGGIAGRVLAKAGGGSVTLFAFACGEGLSGRWLLVMLKEPRS